MNYKVLKRVNTFIIIPMIMCLLYFSCTDDELCFCPSNNELMSRVDKIMRRSNEGSITKKKFHVVHDRTNDFHFDFHDIIGIDTVAFTIDCSCTYDLSTRFFQEYHIFPLTFNNYPSLSYTYADAIPIDSATNYYVLRCRIRAKMRLYGQEIEAWSNVINDTIAKHLFQIEYQ